MHITSRDNSLLRQARAVRDGKVDNLIFVEGLRLCEEVVCSELQIEAVIVSEQLARKDKAIAFLAELENSSTRLTTVSEKLLESVSYTKTPQGIVILASRPESTLEHFNSRQTVNPLIVVMHRINNPVNVGAIFELPKLPAQPGLLPRDKPATRFHLNPCAVQWVQRFVCPSGLGHLMRR